MITKIFDNGWGTEYPAKQFEQIILKPILDQLTESTERVVIINSTWYTNDYHQTVLAWLRQNPVDRIVLVAMLDAAIAQPWQFSEFNCEITGVGYYADSNIDYWALFMARYFETPHLIDLCRIDHVDAPYMCLNRKPHWHRRRLYQALTQLGIVNQGLVSMGSENGQAERVVAVDASVPSLAPNSGSEQYGIPNDITSLGCMSSWQRSFLNIVTETVYGINANHFVSEKIFKPILGLRPFLVYDTDGAHFWLTHRGFEDYTRDFGDISDLDLRNPDNIAPFLVELCQQPRSYWKKKLVDLNQKIMYNRQQYYKYVDKQYHLIQKGIVCPV